ncbi:endonuclease/exonuclease/phosphatase family protein [Rubrivivax rivuli]|uniref:Endonuclease/exonuclease/phosphatase family protein n=1 Tax=Rubrivivax rivuli TaxID=1862385 RepID=A0A437RR00_9BURK|nr:endonuclease/exonuclease/phosphatase family protein [Rubrivivax rivuli]RVU49220.1 endonuclease/exonuclease/phosphatase family protein [Rubrivivax rivuli]
MQRLFCLLAPTAAAAVLLAACGSPPVVQQAAPVSAPAAAPQPVAIAAFNMAWAGTVADFQQHLAVCSAPTVNWCDTRARWQPGTTQATPEESARAAACQQATIAAAGGPQASMRVAPCSAYRNSAPRAPGAPAPDPAAVRNVAAYQAKLDGLRETVEALVQREGVRVIAFQEVSSAEAVRAVLGRYNERFEVCAAPHNAFQTVAFAWDKTLSSTPGVCTPHQPLAVLDPPNDPEAFRRVRPGLALRLTVSGAPVVFMNVHLKAACASATNSNPRFPARLLTDRVEACEVLNRQVPVLESWIEAVAAQTTRFVLLGDFNRRIDEEATMGLAANQVRADGSNPAGPNPVDTQGRVGTRYLWPELNDGSPALFQLPLQATEAGCSGFTGLDHIVVGAGVHTLMQQSAPADIASRKVPVLGRPGQPIESSDHCPKVARLRL